jgi:hypothetical protein
MCHELLTVLGASVQPNLPAAAVYSSLLELLFVQAPVPSISSDLEPALSLGNSVPE